MMPTAEDVAAFLGRTGDAATVALASQHLPIVTQMVRAYVRGNGFTDETPGDDLAAVIVSCAARAVANPEQTVAQDVGPFSIRHGMFNGWTLPELAILHRHRKRAL
jgi:hypothetical protein